ncbi:TPA: ATP-binding protein [Clostridioides difficile]|uniref:ATP-binding protein n=1 Tax=Clostridioides difficile TaxID=1496 RepID=UPI000DEDF155|nr:ATP-binding protein [Clostridioides difficile]HBH0725358.1 ATP-binding protein [Clostridioides difficile]
MITNDKRIRIITGHYGSGKSEFAMNYVVKLRDMVSGKVAIADLDVVNVYFRTREKKELMKSLGIQPIDSSINAPTLDLPAISAEVMSPMVDHSYNSVIDLGGDNVGARVIGRFSHLLKEGYYDMLFVINANREKTQTSEEVIQYIKEIEKSSKLKVTGLINNTHLIRFTTIDDVLRGQKVAKEVSEKCNIPIRYVACLENLVEQLPKDLEGEIFPIKLYMREDWM